MLLLAKIATRWRPWRPSSARRLFNATMSTPSCSCGGHARTRMFAATVSHVCVAPQQHHYRPAARVVARADSKDGSNSMTPDEQAFYDEFLAKKREERQRTLREAARRAKFNPLRSTSTEGADGTSATPADKAGANAGAQPAPPPRLVQRPSSAQPQPRAASATKPQSPVPPTPVRPAQTPLKAPPQAAPAAPVPAPRQAPGPSTPTSRAQAAATPPPPSTTTSPPRQQTTQQTQGRPASNPSVQGGSSRSPAPTEGTPTTQGSSSSDSSSGSGSSSSGNSMTAEEESFYADFLAKKKEDRQRSLREAARRAKFNPLRTAATDGDPATNPKSATPTNTQAAASAPSRPLAAPTPASPPLRPGAPSTQPAAKPSSPSPATPQQQPVAPSRPAKPLQPAAAPSSPAPVAASSPRTPAATPSSPPVQPVPASALRPTPSAPPTLAPSAPTQVPGPTPSAAPRASRPSAPVLRPASKGGFSQRRPGAAAVPRAARAAAPARPSAPRSAFAPRPAVPARPTPPQADEDDDDDDGVDAAMLQELDALALQIMAAGGSQVPRISIPSDQDNAPVQPPPPPPPAAASATQQRQAAEARPRASKPSPPRLFPADGESQQAPAGGAAAARSRAGAGAGRGGGSGGGARGSAGGLTAAQQEAQLMAQLQAIVDQDSDSDDEDDDSPVMKDGTPKREKLVNMDDIDWEALEAYESFEKSLEDQDIIEALNQARRGAGAGAAGTGPPPPLLLTPAAPAPPLKRPAHRPQPGGDSGAPAGAAAAAAEDRTGAGEGAPGTSAAAAALARTRTSSSGAAASTAPSTSASSKTSSQASATTQSNISSSSGSSGSSRMSAKASGVSAEDDDEIASLLDMLDQVEGVRPGPASGARRGGRTGGAAGTGAAADGVDWGALEQLFLGQDLQQQQGELGALTEQLARLNATEAESGSESGVDGVEALPPPWADEVTCLLLGLVMLSARRYINVDLLPEGTPEESRAQDIWDAPWALLVLDDTPRCGLEYANKQALALLGISEFEDVYDLSMYDVVAPDEDTQQEWGWAMADLESQGQGCTTLKTLRLASRNPTAAGAAGGATRGAVGRDVQLFRIDSLGESDTPIGTAVLIRQHQQ